MNVLQVGEKIASFVGVEGIFAQIDNQGLTIYASLIDPTNKEIRDFKANSEFKIKSGVLNGVVFLTIKPGSQPWSDTYLGQVSDDVSFEPVEEGAGLALTLVLIDGRSGEVKSIRLIGLKHRFSMELENQIQDAGELELSHNEIIGRATSVQNKYTTNELVKLLGNRG